MDRQWPLRYRRIARQFIATEVVTSTSVSSDLARGGARQFFVDPAVVSQLRTKLVRRSTSAS